MFFVLGMGQLPPHIYRSISIWTQPIMDTYRRCSAEGQWDASYKWPNELWRTTIIRIHDTNKEKWKSRLIFYFMLSVWFFLFEFFLFFFFFLFNQKCKDNQPFFMRHIVFKSLYQPYFENLVLRFMFETEFVFLFCHSSIIAPRIY